MKITLTDNDGNSQDIALPSNVTLTVAAPAPAPAPAPTPTSVTVTGTLADGTAVSVVLLPGQRKPLVAATPLLGSAVFHADGQSVCLENAYAGTTGDLTGAFKVATSDTVLFTGPLTIWAYSRTRPFWLAPPVPRANPDLSAFPKYGPGSEAATRSDAYLKADNTPMGISLWPVSIGTVGEHPHLGPVPQEDACYLTNPSAENAVVVRGMSDATSPLPFHVIDPATDKMIDVRSYPKISMLGVFRGIAGNPIAKYTTACPYDLGQAQAHAMACNAVACEIYATDYDREELGLWCNYVNSLWQNYSYRLPEGCTTISSSGPRGTGRGLVVELYAARYAEQLDDYFASWIRAQAVDYRHRMEKQSGLQIDQSGAVYANGGYAPWQQHIETYAFGQAVDLGYTEYQWLLDYTASPILDSILSAPHEFATLYSVVTRNVDKTVVKDWASALRATAPGAIKVAAALQCAEGSAELQAALGNIIGYRAGDFSGYPWAPDGYAAMLQPALAMAARHGSDLTRAQTAWAKYKQFARQDYSQNPKYNVIP